MKMLNNPEINKLIPDKKSRELQTIYAKNNNKISFKNPTIEEINLIKSHKSTIANFVSCGGVFMKCLIIFLTLSMCLFTYYFVNKLSNSTENVNELLKIYLIFGMLVVPLFIFVLYFFIFIIFGQKDKSINNLLENNSYNINTSFKCIGYWTTQSYIEDILVNTNYIAFKNENNKNEIFIFDDSYFCGDFKTAENIMIIEFKNVKSYLGFKTENCIIGLVY